MSHFANPYGDPPGWVQGPIGQAQIVDPAAKPPPEFRQIKIPISPTPKGDQDKEVLDPSAAIPPLFEMAEEGWLFDPGRILGEIKDIGGNILETAPEVISNIVIPGVPNVFLDADEHKGFKEDIKTVVESEPGQKVVDIVKDVTPDLSPIGDAFKGIGILLPLILVTLATRGER